jgi:hypothetical protein
MYPTNLLVNVLDILVRRNLSEFKYFLFNMPVIQIIADNSYHDMEEEIHTWYAEDHKCDESE